jgi:flagellar basal-body rod protein FlgF
MDTLTATLTAGMEARMQSLELIANNIANTSSAGYKADRERFSSYLSAAAADALYTGQNETRGEMPVIEDRYTEFQQGTLQETTNPTDLALEGEGFFAVNTPRGIRYTRSGSFRLTADGELRTRVGYQVRVGNSGTSGKLGALGDAPVRVDERGQIWQAREKLGDLEIVRFNRPDLLRKEEGVYFASLPGMTVERSTANVRSQTLESSNVDAGAASIELVNATRSFQFLNRAYNVVANAKRSAVEQVAKW